MIRLNDLTIGYGHRILLQHASATIPAGELVALVGRNGTGKSTLLRAIAGFGERLGGEIRLDGHSLETLSPQQLATTVSFVTTCLLYTSPARVRERQPEAAARAVRA